jgi:hypothetical protein
MKECDTRKSHTSSKLHRSIHILIMLDTLILRLFHYSSLHFVQLHFSPLHYTCRHFTSSHLSFTQLHFTTLSFCLTPFKFPTAPFHLTSLHFTSLHFTSLYGTFRWFLICHANCIIFCIKLTKWLMRKLNIYLMHYNIDI